VGKKGEENGNLRRIWNYYLGAVIKCISKQLY
jgi:hypothetical protein